VAQESHQPATVSPAELMRAAQAAARTVERQIVHVNGTPLAIAPVRRSSARNGSARKPPAPRRRRKTGILKPDDPIFGLVGIFDSGIEGGISERKHEFLGKLRHN
jgi:hypothetical protein